MIEDDIRRLIRENILPRLDTFEYELMMIRKHIWPFVQANKEASQLDEIKEKREFLATLDDETIRQLLIIKGTHSKGGNLCVLEYDKIMEGFPKHDAS